MAVSVSLVTVKLPQREEQSVNWDLASTLGSMSWPAQAVIYLLLSMLARSVSVMIGRGLRYSAARTQSRTFVQQVAGAFHDGNLDEAASIAARSGKSHIAKVVATGLAEFQSATPLLSDADAIETAKRGLQRSASLIHVEMKRGLNGLATIASTAPFVGLFGTVVGIFDAFRGCGMERSACLALTAHGLAEALVTTALGLLVAVPAVWCYNYLANTMEAFDAEIANSSMELVSYLTIRLGQRRQL
jgi:biopolymer transport protein ExbB/TolQ